MFPSIITDTSITVLFPSGPRTVDQSHFNFKKIREQIAARKFNSLEELFDIKQAIARWAKGVYRITEDGVYCGEERIPSCIERRVLGFMDEGLPFEPLLKFHERLALNPSKRAVTELYRFLEHLNIPIDADGFFYCYKSVRQNWYDHHSGKHLNTIGAVLEMPRNMVDDDCSRYCSTGFHAGDLTYASTFGGSNSRLLIVKIDPKDVVSIPLDCNGKKLRTCKYTVVAEYTGPLPDTLYGRVDSDEVDDDCESEECEECGIELTEFDEYTVCDECISNAVSSLEASYTSR